MFDSLSGARAVEKAGGRSCEKITGDFAAKSANSARCACIGSRVRHVGGPILPSSPATPRWVTSSAGCSANGDASTAGDYQVGPAILIYILGHNLSGTANWLPPASKTPPRRRPERPQRCG